MDRRGREARALGKGASFGGEVGPGGEGVAAFFNRPSLGPFCLWSRVGLEGLRSGNFSLFHLSSKGNWRVRGGGERRQRVFLKLVGGWTAF